MKLTQRPYRAISRLDWQFAIFCIIVCVGIVALTAGIVFITTHI